MTITVQAVVATFVAEVSDRTVEVADALLSAIEQAFWIDLGRQASRSRLTTEG